MTQRLQGATVELQRVADAQAAMVLVGEFDVDNAFDLEQLLHAQIDAGRTTLVLDAQGVGFLDSTVLGVLLRAHRRCRQGGGKLVLAGVRGSVARLIETTGLDQIMGGGGAPAPG